MKPVLLWSRHLKRKLSFSIWKGERRWARSDTSSPGSVKRLEARLTRLALISEAVGTFQQ